MEFLEVPLYDDDILKLSVRFLINILFLVVVVVFAIYPNDRKRDFVFTTVMMNVMVFFICFTLKKLDLGLGMALGLFAIFGVLRFRTDSICAKEMTYLFIVIGIAAINSLSNKNTSYAELLLVNFAIIGLALFMERFDALDPQCQHTLDYDKIKWLRPNRRDELMADLKERTGFEVTRVEVKNLDLRKSTAVLTIWHHDPNRIGDPDYDSGREVSANPDPMSEDAKTKESKPKKSKSKGPKQKSPEMKDAGTKDPEVADSVEQPDTDHPS